VFRVRLEIIIRKYRQSYKTRRRLDLFNTHLGISLREKVSIVSFGEGKRKGICNKKLFGESVIQSSTHT